MLEANTAAAKSEQPIRAWTCTRCEVTVSFTHEVERPKLPASWAFEGDALYCLSCRRELAGDAGVEALDDQASSDTRQKARSQGRIEFEIRRDPERPDNQIAKACRTSTIVVRKVRARLGIEPAGTV